MLGNIGHDLVGASLLIYINTRIYSCCCCCCCIIKLKSSYSSEARLVLTIRDRCAREIYDGEAIAWFDDETSGTDVVALGSRAPVVGPSGTIGLVEDGTN